jgi:hypothetical protein
VLLRVLRHPPFLRRHQRLLLGLFGGMLGLGHNQLLMVIKGKLRFLCYSGNFDMSAQYFDARCAAFPEGTRLIATWVFSFAER